MRTTWSGLLVTGALGASGLAALSGAKAHAQSVAGGVQAPAPAAAGAVAPVQGSAGSAPAPAAAALPYAPPRPRVTASPSSLPSNFSASPYAANARGAGAGPSAATVHPFPTPGAGETVPGASAYYGRGVMGSATPSASAPAALPSAASASLPGGRAVAPATGLNYASRAGQGGMAVAPGRPGVNLHGGAATDPSGMRASYANVPSEFRAATDAARRPARGATGSAFAPDSQPYPPAPQPSRLRRFYNWLTGDDKSESRPVHTYLDPSTGRTDLPLSKPWLKQVR